MVDQLKAWIDGAVSRGAVPVLTGRNGDMDTIGSAIALASSHPSLMACGLHLGRLASRLCEDIGAPFRKISEKPSWPNNIGGIIVVDAAAESQTGVKLPDGVPICVIDHHDTCDWKFSEGDLEVRMPVCSTTQIIFTYLQKYSPDTLSDEVRKLLLAGLITDTARFRHADAAALQAGADMMDSAGFEYQEFIEELQQESMTASDRGAVMKALGRNQMTDAGPWNLVHTYAGIHEGRVAGLLVQAGAEVALVSRNRDGETRLTARAPRSSTIEGVHLGRIMEMLSEKLGGDGGGHDGAAGWSGRCERVAAESAFINILAGIKRRSS